ncbi:MAG TPA: hypothetical protein VGQ06_04560 [Gemmatimonadales bacterium]|jgi:hypothetical protein|nr:hypothetical protein [Gemmatimonadales bacterium]
MKIRQAIKRLDAFFRDLKTRPGVMARQLLGQELPGDWQLAELLCKERRALTRMDGSIQSSVFQTAWAAWELMDLGVDALNGGLDRLVSWVLGRFEAGDSGAESLPLALPNGLVLEAAGDAALVTRCLTIRTLVRARHGQRPAVTAAIRELALGPQPATLNLSASVLGALALAPPEHRHHLDGLIGRLGAAQDATGGWAAADLFHMLEALILAGIRPARALISKAVPTLLKLQRADGSFDDAAREERTLIGLRALVIAAEA